MRVQRTLLVEQAQSTARRHHWQQCQCSPHQFLSPLWPYAPCRSSRPCVRTDQ